MKPITRYFFAVQFAVSVSIVSGDASATEAHGIDDVNCLYAPYTRVTTPSQERLGNALDRLRNMTHAIPDMLDILHRRNPAICIETQPLFSRGYLNVESNSIGLREDLNENEMVAILVHELRHLEQLDNGFCPSTDVSMAENARAVFAFEADAMAITSLIAWIMQDRGDPGPWKAINAWEHYSDISEIFEAQYRETGDLGSATGRAFQQWYQSEWRRESYYLSACNDYLDKLDETNLLPSYDLLPDDFLQGLCVLPDGRKYKCSE